MLNQSMIVRALLLCLCCLAGIVRAADYPERPVQIIVPFSAGGSADVRMRQLAQSLSRRFGQQFIVINKPGASGTIGLSHVARARADGYTIGFANNAVLAITPHLQRDIGFDVDKDLAPTTLVALAQAVLVVPSTLPASSVEQLIALGKSKPRKLSYASSGIGSINHLPVELFARSAGVELLHVPYKGEADFMSDLTNGRVDMTITSVTATLPHIKAGTLRALGLGGRRRTSILPGVPTIEEAGVAGFEWHNWFGVVAPVATPDAIVNRLQRELAEILRTPQIQAEYAALGYDIVASSPKQFAATVRADSARYAKLIADIGIKLR